MATNIDTTIELNKLIAQQNQLYLTQAKIMRGQMLLLKNMLEMFQQLDPTQFTAGWNELNAVMQEAEESMESMAGSSQETMGTMNSVLKEGSASAKGLGGGFKIMGKSLMALAGPVGIVSLLSDGLDMAMNAGEGLIGIITSVVSGLGNLAISIITLPFKMLEALLTRASQPGSSELAREIEQVRKSFGDLKTGAARAVLDITRGMKGQLAETGLRVFRIFGNLAERMKAIREIAEQLGPLFNNLAKGIVANGEAFGAYVKGLHLSEEGIKGVGQQALASGKSFTEVSREITTFAFQLGESFGINGAQISKSVGEMLKDVKNFGSLSIKQLSSIAVFANKLGLEFKDLQGIVDRFDNFEQAADAVSQLNQAFGLNLDTLKLVQEQDPAARFDMLRKSFFQTGRAVESMTRQELKLLAAQTGLSEEAVKLGFSQSSQALSYGDIQKQSDLTAKKQLTQAEAMERLANSIERLIKDGMQMENSFFRTFIKGFVFGIERSMDFRKVIIALRRDLRITFQAGRELGNYFVKVFPGVADIFKGLQELFAPNKWRKMMRGVVDAFKEFFRNVLTDPEGGLKALFKKLREVFFDWFDSSKQGGSRILKGFGTFFKVLFKTGVAAIKLGIEGIGDLVKDIFSPGGGRTGEITKVIGEGLMDILTSAFDVLVEGGSVLKDAFLDFYINTWPTIVDGIREFFKSSEGSGPFGKAFASLFDSLIVIAGAVGGMILDFLGALPWKDIGQWLVTKLGELLIYALGAAIVVGIGVMTGPFLLFAGAIYLLFHDTFDSIYDTIAGFVDQVIAVVEDPMKFIFGLVSQLFGPEVAGEAESTFSSIVDSVSSAFNTITGIFEQVRDTIMDVITPIYEFWVGLQVIAMEVLRRVGGAIYTFLEERVGQQISAVIDTLKFLFNNVYEQVSTLVDVIKYLFKTGWDYASDRIEFFKSVISTVASWVNQNLIEPLSDHFQTLKGVWEDYVNKPIIEGLLGIKDASKGILDPIMNVFNTIRGIGRSSGQDLERNQQNLTKNLDKQAKAAVTNARNIAGGTTEAITSATKRINVSKTGRSAAGTTKAGGLDDIMGQLFGQRDDEARKRREALDVVSTLRVPSPARVARLERDIKAIADRYSTGIVDNVRDLVAAVNTVTDQLNKIDGGTPQRINVQLKELANSLGVGGTSRLEIKNRNFTINLNVNVVLDADEFEQALTNRPGGSSFTVKGEA